MQKGIKRWYWGFGAVCWIGISAYLLTKTPAREEGLEATFAGWRYLRCAFQGLALTTIVTALVLLLANARKLLGFVPSFIKYRPLLALLVRRNFMIKYKRSVLGVLWTVLNPLANMVILSIVFSTVFSGTLPYFPAFILSGMVVFGFFSQATGTALVSLVGNASLLRKVYLPKYIFPAASVLTALIDLLFSSVALVVVMVFIGAPFRLSIVGALPVLLYLVVFCMGAGMLLATLFVFFRDTQHLYAVLLTALNYLSAIFYDAAIVPYKFITILAMNPMYHYVRVFRNAVLYGMWPSALDHLICAGMAFIAICAGLLVFYRKQHRFILYI